MLTGVMFFYLQTMYAEIEVFMNINTLLKAAQKPKIYTPGTALMWVDEYISKQLLQVHLSQDIELASRKESTITSTIDWILSTVPNDTLSILDIGCGPGLYTEKLAERGHVVTGMDFSVNSIEHAKESARSKNLDTTYIKQDYLLLDEENSYDLIMMIFTDFGVLSPEQREQLLNNVYRALKPGGVFLFDVLNENSQVKAPKPKEWELSEGGFWRKEPYLAMTESFYYEDEAVSLSQHIVMDDVGGLEVYRFWIHTFTNDDLIAIASSAGFNKSNCYERILPDSVMYRSEDVTFCVATK